MKRAISLLLMVVMVLAPCAVAHAASLSGHHGSSTVATDTAPSGHMHAAPAESHEQHSGCVASDHHTGEDDCSGNCEILQRATSTGVAERSAEQLIVSFAALVIASKTILDTQDNRSDTPLSGRLVGLNSDSKTVLRKTARLRL